MDLEILKALSGRKVAVLCGGPSAEREVSLQSGRAVHDAIAGAGVDSVLLELEHDDISPLKECNPDIVFLALHGYWGEDGQCQRILEGLSLPYTGSPPEACEIAFDKVACKEIFTRAGIPTPAWTHGARQSNYEELLSDAGLSLPLVVKPSRGGSSQGVSIVRSDEEFTRALEECFHYDDACLVEEFVPGREVTVGILNGEALPVIEMRTQRNFYDYQAKYEDDDTEFICPAELSLGERTAVQAISLAAHNAVGARHFSRVDLMLGPDGRPRVLEVNIIPGFTSHSLLPKAARAAGIDFADLCCRLLLMACRGRKLAEK